MNGWNPRTFGVRLVGLCLALQCQYCNRIGPSDVKPKAYVTYKAGGRKPAPAGGSGRAARAGGPAVDAVAEVTDGRGRELRIVRERGDLLDDVLLLEDAPRRVATSPGPKAGTVGWDTESLNS